MYRVPNIMLKALRMIGSTTIQYRKFTGNSTDEIGQRVTTYSDWSAPFEGSVQPGIISSFGGKNVGEKDYAEMGLDFSRSYVTVWADVQIENISDKESPDQIKVYGKIYNVIQCADWIEYNGWKRMYCVEVKNEP